MKLEVPKNARLYMMENIFNQEVALWHYFINRCGPETRVQGHRGQCLKAIGNPRMIPADSDTYII